VCCSFLFGDEDMKSIFPRKTSLGDALEVGVVGGGVVVGLVGAVGFFGGVLMVILSVFFSF